MSSTKWLICYYINEGAYKCGIAAQRESYFGTRAGAIALAQMRLKYSQFKFYDLIQE